MKEKGLVIGKVTPFFFFKQSFCSSDHQRKIVWIRNDIDKLKEKKAETLKDKTIES
ncbi:MAG: hypothetical protein PHU32_03930 [Candidatus ainarchaeum sp.]|nr:hypothetical protein [Candidatus ainarchaeum sp.]